MQLGFGFVCSVANGFFLIQTTSQPAMLLLTLPGPSFPLWCIAITETRGNKCTSFTNHSSTSGTNVRTVGRWCLFLPGTVYAWSCWYCTMCRLMHRKSWQSDKYHWTENNHTHQTVVTSHNWMANYVVWSGSMMTRNPKAWTLTYLFSSRRFVGSVMYSQSHKTNLQALRVKTLQNMCKVNLEVIASLHLKRCIKDKSQDRDSSVQPEPKHGDHYAPHHHVHNWCRVQHSCGCILQWAPQWTGTFGPVELTFSYVHLHHTNLWHKQLPRHSRSKNKCAWHACTDNGLWTKRETLTIKQTQLHVPAQHAERWWVRHKGIPNKLCPCPNMRKSHHEVRFITVQPF